MSDKPRVAAVEGMLDVQSPCLLGTRCSACGTVYFPREENLCRNPRCGSTDFEEKRLSTRGRLWSFTNSCYAPPAPFIAADPYEPITVAAVELEDEKMVVLGQVDGSEVADLETGMEMELVVGPLYEDDDNEYIVWKWRRV